MTEAAKPRRLGRFILVVSLALNLLLLGLIVGAIGSGRAGPQRGFEAGLGDLGQILPREDNEIAQVLTDSLGKQGIGIETGVRVNYVPGLNLGETYDVSFDLVGASTATVANIHSGEYVGLKVDFTPAQLETIRGLTSQKAA